MREDTWGRLDEEQKRTALEEARRVIHERHELMRVTWIEWDDDDDPGLWYDEHSGAVHFPRATARLERPLEIELRR